MIEIERKFLLTDIPAEFIQQADISFITQYYIKNDDFIHRIRKIESKGNITYLETTKIPISNFASKEEENIITENTFNNLIHLTNSSLNKIRYTMCVKNIKWEIDKFEHNDFIIAEMELIREETVDIKELEKEIMNIQTPRIIQDFVIQEVTGDIKWNNYNLSLK